MAEENHNKYILGIIGIVAVVGLFMMLTKLNTSDNGVTGNLALRVPQMMLQQSGDKCNFIGVTGFPEEFRFNTDGNTVCQHLGYKKCLANQIQSDEIYFASNDRSCEGEQDYSTGNFLAECTFKGDNNRQCTTTAEDLGVVEPAVGDTSTPTYMLTGVICCNKN